MNLRDRALRSAPRAEALGTRLEVRLEDRLQHQLQRRLHDPVCGRRDPQAPDLADAFGIAFSATRCGPNCPALSSLRIPASSSAASAPTSRDASLLHKLLRELQLVNRSRHGLDRLGHCCSFPPGEVRRGRPDQLQRLRTLRRPTSGRKRRPVHHARGHYCLGSVSGDSRFKDLGCPGVRDPAAVVDVLGEAGVRVPELVGRCS